MPKWRNGRREGLKNLWALARVGSTPTFGTMKPVHKDSLGTFGAFELTGES